MKNVKVPIWKQGDTIVERHTINDNTTHGDIRFSWGYPLRVWSDDGATTVAYLPPGTIYQGMVAENGEPTRELGAKRKRVDRTWQDHHALRLVREGDEYSVIVFFDDSWHMRCWYVNLQEPVRRFTLGLETRDLILDLLIAPDLSGHRWKDEDELEERIAAGLYEPSDMTRLKAVGR